MIYSMTGYGGAEACVDAVTYIVEVKTVNNRYFKTKLQLPNAAAFIGDDIESLLRRNISRGMVNLVVYIKNAPAGLLFDIDEGVLGQLLQRLEKIARQTKIKYTVDIGNLLNLPDIVQPASLDEKSAQKIKAIILEADGEGGFVRQTNACSGRRGPCRGPGKTLCRAEGKTFSYQGPLRRGFNGLCRSAEEKGG